MTDSSKYSTLFALVDSHLSKTSLQENGRDTNPPTNVSPLSSLHDGSGSESILLKYTKPRLPIPVLSTNNSPIQNVLAQQVANMLKAKENEEEKKRLEVNMKHLKIEDDNSVIDLMAAIQTPYNPEASTSIQETVSRSSSTESLFKLKFTDDDDNKCDDKSEKPNSPEPVLCLQDVSYILKQKMKMGKCSTLGKIMSRRYKNNAPPYLKERFHSNIVRFKFDTPSPCDIIKANLKKPTVSCSFTLDITQFV